jgi:DNA polymerase-3 subunit gamma/tau
MGKPQEEAPVERETSAPEPENTNPEIISSPIEEKPVEYPENEAVLIAWNEYCLLLKNEGKLNLYNTLSKHPIRIANTNTIELDLDNKLQEADIQKQKPEILGWLKTKLNIEELDLIPIVLAKAIEEKQIIYTSQDVYKIMVEKNPNLAKMKELFGLKTDI